MLLRLGSGGVRLGERRVLLDQLGLYGIGHVRQVAVVAEVVLWLPGVVRRAPAGVIARPVVPGGRQPLLGLGMGRANAILCPVVGMREITHRLAFVVAHVGVNVVRLRLVRFSECPFAVFTARVQVLVPFPVTGLGGRDRLRRWGWRGCTRFVVVAKHRLLPGCRFRLAGELRRLILARERHAVVGFLRLGRLG